ncbi:MAG: hypothetical protein E6J71_25015 [Deltaproteobacteria bacterium]|nr:MAG: hypothetical protein E6J76_12465 [Deltaproteobacteria bacterium]TMB11733.1 MAG: hypothetical protein E6J71_25015 [Deltaproteobacteria bacterium]
MRVSLLVSALILLAAPPVVRAARSKCDLVVNAEGIAEKPEHSKSCTDGDSACDTGQSADGICQYHVSLCFKTAAKGACAREEIEGMSVTAGPGLEGLVGAMTRFKTNLTADSCTEPVDVQVQTRGKRIGRTLLKAKGPAGRERYTFVCRPSHQGGGSSATFAKDIQKKIFDSTCATPSCHGAGAASAGLDLSDGAAYSNLVGVPAANEAARTAGLLRVAPGDPDHSYLLLKLEGTLAAGEGVPMPLVGGPLPASAIDTIRRWIAAGAPETAPF